MSIKIKNSGWKEIIFSEENPTETYNPPYKNVLWINTRTGELFVCLDNTPNRNMWRGNMGTRVPCYVDRVDPFEDGSGIALWRFEGNANDDGGRWNGTVQGAVRFGDKIIGQSARLQGGYISLPDGPEEVVRPGNTWTISAWIEPEGIVSQVAHPVDFKGKFFIKIDTTSARAITIVHNNSGGSYGVALSTTLPKLGYSFNIIVSYDGSDYVVWIDGTRITPDSTSVTINPDQPSNTFGGSSWSGDSTFRGYIDQVRIFNRAISDKEAKIVYQETPVLPPEGVHGCRT